jgi:hypothetical protein
VALSFHHLSNQTYAPLTRNCRARDPQLTAGSIAEASRDIQPQFQHYYEGLIGLNQQIDIPPPFLG